ncbi:hypothetical protein GCM10022403_033300 [Streptomyces coacervatus]|uniref:Uncharacterized protein n=1 Tax=Streptomyces coacervatus TaxID=647381 RepID=A0ABP7HJJ0_9ACTN
MGGRSVVARSPVAWWSQLRTALDSLAEAPTERIAVREECIRRAVPQYTGRDVGDIEWSTAHGDFHWSNLGGPDLTKQVDGCLDAVGGHDRIRSRVGASVPSSRGGRVRCHGCRSSRPRQRASAPAASESSA